MLVTALAPKIGYDAAAKIAKAAHAKGTTLRAEAVGSGHVSEAEFERLCRSGNIPTHQRNAKDAIVLASLALWHSLNDQNMRFLAGKATF